MCNTLTSWKKDKTIFSKACPAKWTLLWISMGKYNFQLSVVWYYVSFLNFLLVNHEDTDQTPHSVASDLSALFVFIQ